MTVALAAIVPFARRFATDAGTRIVLWGVAGLLGLAAFGCLLAALAIHWSAAYGGVAASLMVAAILAGLALVTLVAEWILRARARRRARREAIAESAVALIPLLMRAHPIAALVLVGAAAHILARRD